MKKWLIPVIIVAVIAFAIYRMAVGFYNTSVDLEENAKTSWSNVESAYQRRADLIPNLVSTVKGYAAHEKETLEGVIKARAEATKTTIDPTNITPEKMAAFQKAQDGLSGALSRLLVTVERYPDLKANQNFLELQSQLEGTENRINVERNRFNTDVNVFSKHIKKFPNNILNNFIGNFKEMARFQAAEGSDVAPKVEF
ncbi:LemA family protein [Lutibacter sp.]|uniref:LemA family protein n=1 Tax=Lutibacter sp. TaxID=1925666 RepID=UPI003567FECC